MSTCNACGERVAGIFAPECSDQNSTDYSHNADCDSCHRETNATLHPAYPTSSVRLLPPHGRLAGPTLHISGFTTGGKRFRGSRRATGLKVGSKPPRPPPKPSPLSFG